MIKAIIAVTTALALASCQSVTDVISVDADDNASLCIMTSVNGSVTNTQVTGKRIELPAKLDASILTVDDLERLEQVLCR
ncbi:MAG: hypothetical protein WEB57_08065 [Pseudohongiellaceae bacterium]